MKRIAGRLLASWIATSALGFVVGQALAQPAADYPAKSVRVVIVYAPGGGVDIVGRQVADRLTRSWGRTVVVENHAGVAGNIGTAYVSRMGEGTQMVVAHA